MDNLIMCDCKSHALELEYDSKLKLYFLYIWYRQDSNLFPRLKKAWQLLRHGKVIIDDVVLTQEELDKFQYEIEKHRVVAQSG